MLSCIQTSADSIMCTITEKVEEGHNFIAIEPVDRVRCGTTSLWTLGCVGICEFRSEFVDAQCVLHPLKCKVLLLYAQNCEPFMKLMTTFRELLSNVAECEVLDCFDPQRAEELAENPCEWMCGWVSNPNVKVVVVTSDCAVAHQNALASNGCLQYRRPVHFNDLFLLGLKEVIYIHKNEYLRTLVVRFNVSGKDFSYLTPYTRFVLPQHLELLLKNLNPNIDTSVLNECQYGEKLQNDYEAFLHYREQNPLYFTQRFEQEVI